MNDDAFKTYVRRTMEDRQMPWLENGLIWFIYGVVFILGTPLLIAALPLIGLGWVLERLVIWLTLRLFEGEADE